MRVFVGVDPGMAGALVSIDESGRVRGSLLMPTLHRGVRQRVDCEAIARHVQHVSKGEPGDVVIAVEKVGAMPTDRPKAAFTFGMALAPIYAIAEVSGYAIVEVRAVDWQRVLLRGLPRGPKVKASAAKSAGDLFPCLREDLRVKARWGLADAALIAEHARRQYHRADVIR